MDGVPPVTQVLIPSGEEFTLPDAGTAQSWYHSHVVTRMDSQCLSRRVDHARRDGHATGTSLDDHASTAGTCRAYRDHRGCTHCRRPCYHLVRWHRLGIFTTDERSYSKAYKMRSARMKPRHRQPGTVAITPLFLQRRTEVSPSGDVFAYATVWSLFQQILSCFLPGQQYGGLALYLSPSTRFSFA